MKNVIITGTSRGIGLELVKCFAKAGHQVLALSRNDKPISDLKLKNVTAFCFNLEENLDFEKVNTYVKTSWEQVDVLIHNAGSLVNKPFLELTKTDFQT